MTEKWRWKNTALDMLFFSFLAKSCNCLCSGILFICWYQREMLISIYVSGLWMHFSNLTWSLLFIVFFFYFFFWSLKSSINAEIFFFFILAFTFPPGHFFPFCYSFRIWIIAQKNAPVMLGIDAKTLQYAIIFSFYIFVP